MYFKRFSAVCIAHFDFYGIAKGVVNHGKKIKWLWYVNIHF